MSDELPSPIAKEQRRPIFDKASEETVILLRNRALRWLIEGSYNQASVNGTDVKKIAIPYEGMESSWMTLVSIERDPLVDTSFAAENIALARLVAPERIRTCAPGSRTETPPCITTNFFLGHGPVLMQPEHADNYKRIMTTATVVTLSGVGGIAMLNQDATSPDQRLTYHEKQPGNIYRTTLGEVHAGYGFLNPDDPRISMAFVKPVPSPL